MKYLHTMVRVKNIEESLDFYCNKLGLKEVRRRDSEKGKFTLIFLAAENSDEKTGLLELTYNLGSRRIFRWKEILGIWAYSGKKYL
jgi:Lactoylglutathione lyase and related lyases